MKWFLPADSSLDDVVVKTWEILFPPKLLEKLKKILQENSKGEIVILHDTEIVRQLCFIGPDLLAFIELKRIWLKPIVITEQGVTDKEKLLISQWHWS